ncbi:hypothetical protein G6F22_018568 [Rhizopus arrhizus]|nr:hypothetical protein G6F22_018568 [Rhizopus arrhizus]KAG0921211.1 hypothetical protein G6F32_015209 [Rhizopus arrhizus]
MAASLRLQRTTVQDAAARRRAPAGVVECDLPLQRQRRSVRRRAVQPQQGRPDLQRAAHCWSRPACVQPGHRHPDRRAGGSAGRPPEQPGQHAAAVRVHLLRSRPAPEGQHPGVLPRAGRRARQR